MRALFLSLERCVQDLPPARGLIIGSGCLLLVGLTDIFTPHLYDFTLLYLLAVALVGWTAGRLPAVAVGLLSGTALAGQYDIHDFTTSRFLWNVGTKVAIFCGTGWVTAEVARLYRQRQELADERTRQLYREVQEHRVTAARLAESLERFEQMANSTTQLLWLADVKPPRVIYVSPAYDRIWGQPRTELEYCPRKWLDSVHPEDRPPILEALDKPEQKATLDFRLIRPGNQVLWVRAHIHPVRNGAGEVFRRAGIVEDITDRKVAQLELAHRERQHRAIVQTAMDGFVVVAPSARINEVNDAYCRITGFSREELLQRSVADMEFLEDAQQIAQRMERIKARGFDRFETRHRTRDGGSVQVEVSVSSPAELEGSCYCFVRDITERHHGELSLRLQKEVASLLSVATDTQRALSGVLKVFLQIENIHWCCAHLFHPTSGSFRLAAQEGKPAPFLDFLFDLPAGSPQAKLILEGRPLYLRRPQFIPPDGAYGNLRSAAVIPFSHEQRFVGALMMASETCQEFPTRDRVLLESIVAHAAGALARIHAEQQRQQLQDELLDISDREQERIGQEIHDGLCQELVSLAFDANSLQEQLTGAPPRTMATARRLAHYLDLAITESRKLARGLFPVRLDGETLGAALQDLARSIEERFHVQCRAEVDTARLPAKTAVNLYRIAQEAMNNAIKHSHANKLSLKLRREPAEVHMIIHDNGTGFEEQPGDTGRGMGLHIMNYRAQAIGATLRVDSRPGEGTTISCCLPTGESRMIPA